MFNDTETEHTRRKQLREQQICEQKKQEGIQRLLRDIFAPLDADASDTPTIAPLRSNT